MSISMEPSDPMTQRYLRWCALVIDGRQFGDHPMPDPHFEEKAALAIILVSCGVDQDVVCARRLEERQTVHTPDFEAMLRNGQTVRIEVTQFNDQDAMTYQNQWNAVFGIVQHRRAEDPTLRQHLCGLGIVFEIPRASPKFEIASDVAEEILSLLRSIDRNIVRRPVVVPEAFPALHYCGATYQIADTGLSHSTVRFALPLGISDPQRILASVPVRIAAKAAKHFDYSDGGAVPVWLAVFARDEAAGYNLTAIQELARTAKEVTVEPFERLMIANTVAGLLVDANRMGPAYYRSLTVPLCEIPRI